MDSADERESRGDAASTPVPRTPSETDTARQIRAYQRQLRRLASELSLAEARERREIASELHDHIGQALAYVSQKVATLQGNAVFSGMEEDFSEILSILNQTIQYTRNLTVAISPPVLYELGLPAAIDWLAERAIHRYGREVLSFQTGTPREIPEDISVFIFKAVQELIANAAKHGEPERVTVRTNWLEDRFEVVVTDDGNGFETETLDGCLADGNCFGLFSIRERLSYVGGELTIKSKPGDGTRVSVTTGYSLTAEDKSD